VAAAGVLVVARGTLRGSRPAPVRHEGGDRTPDASAEDFPAYRSIASDLEWGRLSRRHYQHAVRPLLTRLATALGRPAPADLPPLPADTDGPGPDLATLERMISQLEDRK
jgi:hypothetical protein